MMRIHVEDIAELYALGSLDERERAEVESHLRTCPLCAQAVANAERDVATIASMERRQEAPPELETRIDRVLQAQSFSRAGRALPSAWMVPAALAAALVIGLLPTAYFWSENRAMRDAMVAQSAAIGRLASGPYRTADFSTARANPHARVVYGTDGSWYLVIVPGASRRLAVAWMHGGKRTMLGNAVPHGNFATLYLPKSHRMDRLALMDGDRVVAEATLTWQRTVPNRQAVQSG
jgi:anti-sigma factor RsiW